VSACCTNQDTRIKIRSSIQNGFFDAERCKKIPDLGQAFSFDVFR
jgi:hypothetical protein